MTTDHDGWGVFEYTMRGDPRQREAELAVMGSRVVKVLCEADHQVVQGVFWTPFSVEDSRLNRKRGFWRGQTTLRAAVPLEAHITERAVSSADGLHFVATATVTQREFSLLIKACHAYAHLRSFVVLSDVGSDWSESLLGDERGLSRKFAYELSLLKFLAPHSRSRDAIVVLPFGRFDDHEWGLMGVGPESRVMSERLRGLGYDRSWTGELGP